MPLNNRFQLLFLLRQPLSEIILMPDFQLSVLPLLLLQELLEGRNGLVGLLDLYVVSLHLDLRLTELRENIRAANRLLR
jgi:hypothetical protein